MYLIRQDNELLKEALALSKSISLAAIRENIRKRRLKIALKYQKYLEKEMKNNLEIINCAYYCEHQSI